MPVKILLSVLLLNSFTFILFSIWSPNIGAPQLITYREANSDNVTIIIAGNLNNARNVAGHLADSIPGTIIAANFQSTGYRPQKFVQAIERLIRTFPPDTNVQLIAVSLGTQPAQTIANHTGVPLYALNPCMNAKFLQPGWRNACYATYIIGTPLKYALGWVSFVPIIPMFSKLPDHENYSIATLVEQYRAIIRYQTEKPTNTSVIISDQDEILINSEIEKYFSGCPTEHIDTQHGRTYLPAYSEALRKLLP